MESALLIIFAGIFKACADKMTFHYHVSVFKELDMDWYFDPSQSWKNKYKDDLITPRFWGSTTTFVFLTDAWHLANAIWSTCFILAIFTYDSTNAWYVDFILLKGAYGLFFELFWKYVLDQRFYDR